MEPGVLSAVVVVSVLLWLINCHLLYTYVDLTVSTGWCHSIARILLLTVAFGGEMVILLLPVDVANRAGLVSCQWSGSAGCGTMDLPVVWDVAFAVLTGCLCLLLPAYVLFYEALDEDVSAPDERHEARLKGSANRCYKMLGCNQASGNTNYGAAVTYASVGTLVVAGAAACLLGIAYPFANTAYIPVLNTAVDFTSRSTNLAAWGRFDSKVSAVVCLVGTICPCGTGDCIKDRSVLALPSTLVVFAGALLTFVGWVAFSAWAGVGLVALPLELINVWVFRPQLLTRRQVLMQRQALGSRALDLLKVCEHAAERYSTMTEENTVKPMTSAARSERKKADRILSGEVLRLKALTLSLENDLEKLKCVDPDTLAYNPWRPWASLVWGVLAFLLSLAWILHIILFLLLSPSAHPFLNDALNDIAKRSTLAGVVLLSALAVYMLFASSVGVRYLGSRLFLLQIHPLERGKTLMNSIAVNLSLVLLCVLPCTALCAEAFAAYTRGSDVDVILGTQFRYMEGMRYVYAYKVFYWIILGMGVLSGLYFSYVPSERAHLNNLLQSLRAEHVGERARLTRKLERNGGTLQGVA